MNKRILPCMLIALNAFAAALHSGERPLFEKERPAWEIKFRPASDWVMSVMPGESSKVFHDPLLNRDIKWEQDVYCPTFTVYDGKLYCVYRAWGEDQQWRMGLAWSEDGLNFTRSNEPVFHAKPTDEFLGDLRNLKDASVSYGDSRLFADEDGTYYLFFNYFSVGRVNDQELVVASTRDMKNWKMHGRIFARHAAKDRKVIPEKTPWRFPHPAIVTQFEGDRFVVKKIDGKYWMYLNVLSNEQDYSFCMATSTNMVDWTVLRDERGQLVHPMPQRAGYFDSRYIDTTAAVLRDDGILLIYNGINDFTEQTAPASDRRPYRMDGDPRLLPGAHYPAQALFDRRVPHRLLARGESPFQGGDPELERLPIVFWNAPLYESWSLAPWKGELLLYWNHAFGRRAVGLWKGPMPANVGGTPIL